MERIFLKDICKKDSSNIAQKDLDGHSGAYPIYGASGFIKNIDFYKQEKPYIAVVKDGAGVGRVMKLPAKSSVIGTMQYIIPDEGIDVSYLAFALDHMNLAKYYTGATIPHIYFKDYCNEQLLKYSFDEQKCIATLLDKVSDLIALRKQQLAKLGELVKSRFVEMFGDITDTVPLSYYIAGLSAGKSLAGEEECPNKVLKTGAATYDYFDPTQVKNLPMDYEPLEDHRVKTGDVIISRMNTAELVGAAAYVWEAPERTYLPDRLWRAEIKETVCPVFLWQVLIQSSTKENIRRIASGTSGSMKNISKPGLLGIRVKKAPLVLQEKFAAFVEQTDKSKLTIQQSLDKLELLKKALMQKYFG